MSSDSVYFDARRAIEQKLQDKMEEEVRQTEKEKNMAMGAAVLAFLAAIAISPIVLMLLWNWLMPSIFGLGSIGYFQAFGLFIISRILFKHD